MNDYDTELADLAYRPYDQTHTIKCACGATITIDNGWANGCPTCHREYNGAGQQLAPRSQWGEETGETF